MRPPGEGGSRFSNAYKLLRASWRYQAREFFDNSTLHGVRYIAEDGRPMYEKLLWFISTSTGTVAALIIIVSLWEKFQNSPTITGMDTDVHSWDVPFPAVTICLHDPSNESLIEEYIDKHWPNADGEKREYYSSFLVALSNTSLKSLPLLYNFTKDRTLPQESLRSIAFQLVSHCHVLERCSFKQDISVEDTPCCSLFFPILTENGFCYAFNLNFTQPDFLWGPKPPRPFKTEYIQETDVKWSISFDNGDNLNNSIHVYVTENNHLPGYDMPPQHIWTKRVSKLSFIPKNTYTAPDARQLSIHQRGCIFPDEVKITTSDEYTFTGCMTQCRMERLRAQCGCVPHFYPELPGFQHCTLAGLGCIAENIHLVSPANINCPCSLSCQTTLYEMEKPHEAGGENSADTSALEVAFVSWPMTRYKREVLFGWVDLLVAFGGIAGLFLGFSLLSGVEIIYYFTLRAGCMLMSDKQELERLAEEYTSKERAPVDLSLRPGFVPKKRPITPETIWVHPFLP